jgi:hypothetical protein
MDYAGITVTIVLALFELAAHRGRPTIISDEGTLLFRYSVLFRGFARFAMFGIPLAITALGFSRPPKNQDDLRAFIGMYALFAVLTIPLWWEATRFALILTTEGLDYLSPWRGRQFIAWDEIEELSYSLLCQWFIVRAKDGRRIRVSMLVSGVSAFLAECEQHLHPSSLIGAKAGYGLVGRTFPYL